jgi:tetratricopeptide (TPR) repeat protein
MINSIPAHLVEEQFACTDCHNAHTSSIKYLLKEASLLTGSGIEKIESVGKAVQNQIHIEPEKSERELYGLKEMTGTTSLQTNSMFQVFLTVSQLIEKGQIKEARAYLEKFNQNDVFNSERWEQIVQVLNQIDVTASRTEKNAEKLKQQKAEPEQKPERPITKNHISNSQLSKNRREIAQLYYLSLAYYYAGRLEKAKEALLELLKRDSILPEVAKTVKDDLISIDKRLTINVRKRDIAKLYYRSMAFYHAGQYEKARKGLVKILKSGLVPEPMILTIKDCLTNIDNNLSRK